MFGMVVQLAPLSTNFSRGIYDFFYHCVTATVGFEPRSKAW